MSAASWRVRRRAVVLNAFCFALLFYFICLGLPVGLKGKSLLWDAVHLDLVMN